MISKLLWLTITSFIFAAEKKVLKDEFKSKTFFISELIPANPVLMKMQKDFFSFYKKNLEEQIANSFYDDDTFNKMFLEKNSDIWQKSFYEKYKDSIDLIFNEMLNNKDIFYLKKMLSDESKKICTTYLHTMKEKNESQRITGETISSDQRNLESFITNLETMLDNSIFRNKNDLEDIKTFQRDVLKRGLVLYFKILYSIFCLEIKKIKSMKYIEENPSNSEFKGGETTTICKESLEEILEKLIEIKHLAFLDAKNLYDGPKKRESLDEQDYTIIEKSVGAIDIYRSISLAIDAFINKNSGFNLQEYLDNSSYIKEIKNHAIYENLEKGKLDKLFGETLKNVKVEDFLPWFIKNLKRNNIQESSKKLNENNIDVIDEFELEKSVFFSNRQESLIQEDLDKTLIDLLKHLKLIKKILVKKIVYLHYDSKFFALQNKSYKRILSYLKIKSQKDRREKLKKEKQENPESKSETSESKIEVIYNYEIIDLLIDTICSISNDNVIFGTAPYSLFYSPFTSIILKVKRFNTAEKVIEKVDEVEDLMDFLLFEFVFLDE